MVNSGRKTVLIHVSQLSALHWKYGSQQPYRCAHVHVKYGAFWKIISTRKLNLKFIFVGRNILAHW